MEVPVEELRRARVTRDVKFLPELGPPAVFCREGPVAETLS